jgi:uncharacterized protein YgbK (DUF1537 family)
MRIRLLADDLTGALDTAARLVALDAPLPVLWSFAAARKVQASLAFDAACRELTEAEARARFAAAAGLLAGDGLAFLKLDSLLRGHPAAAIACCMREGGFDHAVIAPAFPAQGRVTVDGRLLVLRSGTPPAPGLDLGGALAAQGVRPLRRRPGDAAPAGASLWDACSETDLTQVAAAGRALPGRVLWCGSAGLAGALAGAVPAVRGGGAPLLALIGSDHPVSVRQVAAVAPWHVQLGSAGQGDAAVRARLAAGAAVATVALPDGTSRVEAARLIGARFANLLAGLPVPGTLLAAGGETLRAACDALSATRLIVSGEWEPGLAVSRMVDGAWAGTPVMSKSGAFGDDLLLRRLTEAAQG